MSPSHKSHISFLKETTASELLKKKNSIEWNQVYFKSDTNKIWVFWRINKYGYMESV